MSTRLRKPANRVHYDFIGHTGGASGRKEKRERNGVAAFPPSVVHRVLRKHESDGGLAERPVSSLEHT